MYIKSINPTCPIQKEREKELLRYAAEYTVRYNSAQQIQDNAFWRRWPNKKNLWLTRRKSGIRNLWLWRKLVRAMQQDGYYTSSGVCGAVSDKIMGEFHGVLSGVYASKTYGTRRTIAHAALVGDEIEQEYIRKQRGYWQQEHDYFKTEQKKAGKEGNIELAKHYKEAVSECRSHLFGWKVVASRELYPFEPIEESEDISPYADMAYNSILYMERSSHDK